MAKPTKELVLDDFPFQTYDKLRYADTDRQGHVNNAVFSTFLETGRVEFLLDPSKPLTDEGASFVIANISLNLLSEVNWPGKVNIGTGITKIGNSSIGMFQGVYQNDQCVATSQTVIVQMNNETRKSHPLSKKTKDFLARHLISTE
ncbi:acyl-CoA thioesterase [Curvivirga aplysinae]|uniref:acyl-CoA thioesterase n=1 Tax=Curvivirga aplysinae TaxID=2529852 RepID=UPI0012BC5BD9|nr:thioesterase family protein [Curvivirga aplysinae]MTI09771.1 acyl-CoA thioesterase [Curvivirga aplysinae]